MRASSSLAGWILAAAASCGVVALLFDLVNPGPDVEGPQRPTAIRGPAAPTPLRVGADGPDRGLDNARDASPGPEHAGSRTTRQVAAPGGGQFPGLRAPGSDPDRLAVRRERALVRRRLREARREARLHMRSGGVQVRTLLDADGNAVPYAVAKQGDPHPTNAPIVVADLARKLGELGGSVSFWLQPQWQEGNQDDASFVEIADGQLRLVKNVNVLRFEFMDNAGREHGIAAPITNWKTGEWHQVAGSWDGSTFQLYFDGELVQEATLDSPLFLPEKPQMLVGSNYPPNRPVAPGVVGGLEVRGKPLSPREAMRRFVVGATG